MVDVTPLIKQGSQIIQGYGDGGFRVSQVAYEGAVIVTAQETIAWSPAHTNLKEMQESDFAPLIDRAQDIDVVLLGCGEKIAFMPAPLKQELRAHGLVIEVMDSGAACRTYNVLMAEGRRVAAALLPF
ncbi:MAG: hypothetical protein CMH26_07090 [Micavibrio sp.]|nr:hypothetical protein [Micavibrio sp.]|tara:strand:+ start:269 stop:652 length:384 start_codon:yes stop_codon:yes gene_type:complete